jgi:glycosyltransferase involved in cell wall biosynthesis
MWNSPSYLILRDIFPEWAVDTGILRKGLLYRYFKRRELEQYVAADVIGVEAPGNLPYFKDDIRNTKYNVEVLYNWINIQGSPRATIGWRRKMELEGKVVFFYGGNIGKAQDMDNILRLAVSLRGREDIFFLLIGSGSEVQRLRGLIMRLDLHNIRILPSLAQREYMECLSEFDVGLVSLDRRLKSHNFTGKMLSYVLCGKPILASVNPGNDLLGFLDQADAGIGCTNGEDNDLHSAALRLATDPVLRERMGRNARALGDSTFSVRVAAGQILAHFDSTHGEC